MVQVCSLAAFFIITMIQVHIYCKDLYSATSENTPPPEIDPYEKKYNIYQHDSRVPRSLSIYTTYTHIYVYVCNTKQNEILYLFLIDIGSPIMLDFTR